MTKPVGTILMQIADVLISFLVVAPFAVFYWRGSWRIIDLYLLPDKPLWNAWISFAIGHAIMIIACFIQGSAKTLATRGKLVFFLVSRLYTYVVAFGSVNQWHGVWLAYDLHAGTSWLSALSSFLIGAICLCGFHSYKNVLAPPLTIAHDTEIEEYFTSSTRLLEQDFLSIFSTSWKQVIGFTPSLIGLAMGSCIVQCIADNKDKPGPVNPSVYYIHEDIYWSNEKDRQMIYWLFECLNIYLNVYRIMNLKTGRPLQVLDVLFTVLVNGTMIVLVWRGQWLLFDLVLPPEDTLHSVLFTLAIAFGLTVIIYPLQYIVRNASDSTDQISILKLFLEDSYMIAASIIPVAMWRGVWLALDALVLPDDAESSVWLTHAVGLGGLVLLGVSNSVIVRGCLLDGKHDKDNDGIFDLRYLRFFIDRSRSAEYDIKSNDVATVSL